MENIFEKLVVKAKEKSKEAALEIIERLEPLICANVRRSGNCLERDDLYQEFCLVVLECINTYDMGRGVPFLAYVKKAMIYRAWSLKRTQRSEISLDAEDEEGNALRDSLRDPDGDAQDAFFMQYENRRLEEGLESLSSKQRQVIVSHFFKGEKLNQIAAKQGKHPKGIMSLKKRGLLALRDELN